MAIALLVGRTGDSPLRVPDAILDYQEQIAGDAANSVRRSVNEGVNDLDQLSRLMEASGSAAPAQLTVPLREFIGAHKRYTTIVAVDRRGRVVAKAGARLPADALLPAAARAGAPGMIEVARPSGQTPLLEQFAPVSAPGSRVAALVGYYDPGYMRFGLEGTRPGNGWVVNVRGQVVGTRVGVQRLEKLPRVALREAAAQAVADRTGARSIGGSIDTQEVVGFAPVTGAGPAGNLGWSVLATRDVSSLALPQTEARRQALLAGVAIGVLILLIFGWLYVVVLAPALRMQHEAERLAHGDLSKSVEIVRYDEIGLTGRALERLRIVLIRKDAQNGSSKENGNGNPRRRVEVR